MGMVDQIGIDIGSQVLKWVSLRTTSKGPFLTGLGMKAIPYHEGGDERTILRETLKHLLQEAPFSLKRASLAVYGEGFHLLRLSLPSMPRSELSEAIRWELKGQLSFPLETAQTDFYILDEYQEEGIKKLDLMAVVCPLDQIEGTLSIVKEAGLKPEHLTIPPLALSRAFLEQRGGGADEVVALIDLGAARTRISFIKKGLVQYYREVSPGGLDLTRAIAEGIGSEAPPEALYEEAEKIKYALGLALEEDEKGVIEASIPSSPQEGKGLSESLLQSASYRVRPLLEKLGGELHRSIDYFQSSSGGGRVSQVLLTGGTAKMPSLTLFLRKELNLPVHLFNPLEKLPYDGDRVDPSLRTDHGTQFAAAFGLALSQKERIELLPIKTSFWQSFRSIRDLKRQVSILSLFSFLIVLLTLLGFSWIVSKMNGEGASLQRELEHRTEKIKGIEDIRAKITLLKEKEAQLKGRLLLVPQWIGPSSYSEVLKGITQALPQNVALRGISLQTKTEGQKGEVRSPSSREKPWPDRKQEVLYLSGLAFGNDLQCLTAMARMVERLEGNPLFRDVRLLSMEEEKSYNQPGVRFEMACDVEPLPVKEKRQEKRSKD